MASILKAIRRSSIGHQAEAIFDGHGKPRKLGEEWMYEDREPIMEGVTFYVKYLGSCMLNQEEEDCCATGVRKIVDMARTSTQRYLDRVALTVSIRGISMSSCPPAPEHKLDVSIYKISHCAADAFYTHIFSFLSLNPNGWTECHAFVCPKRKVAEAITLTVAKSFDMAFELWKKAHEDVAKEHNSDEDSDEELNTELIQKEPSPEEREKTAPKSPQTNNAPILPPPPPTKEAPPLLDLSSEPVSPVAPSLPPPLVPGNTTEVPAKRSSPPKAWSPGVAGGGGRLPKPPSMKQLQKVASHHAIQKMGFQDDFSSMNARFSQIAITPERNSMLSTSARSKLSARDLKQIAFEHSHSDLTTLAETHETGLPNWDEILKQPSDHHEPTSSLFIIGGDDDPWSPKSTPSPPPSHSNSNPFR